ncbi:hypothetical protein NPIL_564611 [Nephila pilipes]|uniref:Uncharacterized protein n=1 Tax=Nephila pilipes TaxID=299642 RepID=A0A8X6PMS5_NEPPI|nr:hypothetical protein NPIL_564611 [Nephila pilipes]
MHSKRPWTCHATCPVITPLCFFKIGSCTPRRATSATRLAAPAPRILRLHPPPLRRPNDFSPFFLYICFARKASSPLSRPPGARRCQNSSLCTPGSPRESFAAGFGYSSME